MAEAMSAYEALSKASHLARSHLGSRSSRTSVLDVGSRLAVVAASGVWALRRSGQEILGLPGVVLSPLLFFFPNSSGPGLVGG